MTVTTTPGPGRGAPAVAVEGADGDDLIAVHQVPGVVDGNHPVGVAVEGHSGVGPHLGHRGLKALGDGWNRTRR